MRPPAAQRIEVSDLDRHRHEIALGERGFVPLTAHDAPYQHFDSLLPTCRVEEIVVDRSHGRIVWSHPGASGLDPRAIAPLALVRVADGIGPDPLDPTLKLDEAAQWLLGGDVEPWLTRERHRIVVRYEEVMCVYESTGRCGRCLTHLLSDPLLQQVADVLGDTSYEACRPHRWTEPHCVVWEKDSDRMHDRGGVARCALAATHRLGRMYRDGLSGVRAWELARGGAQTSGAALVLPPAPEPDPYRGLGGFARWKISCHQPERYRQMVPCRLCGVRDDTSPCRTCLEEGRTTPWLTDWREYGAFADLHPSYRPGAPLPAVACGDLICRTPLSLSAAGAEGMTQ